MMDQRPSDDLSIEQIEGTAWGTAPAGATALVATVHELRRKPVRTLSAEDLRVLIAQRVGLDVLIPRALDRLEQEPLLEGDYYPGDVLVAVLGVPFEYWSEHRAQLDRIDSIITTIEDPGADLARDIEGFRQRSKSVRP
jgi:hypothetical protein